MAYLAAVAHAAPDSDATAPAPAPSAQKPGKAAKPEHKSEKPQLKSDKSTKPAASSDKFRDAHKADTAGKSGKPTAQTSADKLSTPAEKSADAARKADTK